MIENLELEEWRTLEDFPRYMISNYGRLKSCIGTEKILKPSKVKGYLIVKLSGKPTEQGKYKHKCFKVHRLVSKYFSEGFADDKHVHHLDKQRDNNYYKNLMCLSKAEHAAIHKELNNNNRAAAESAAAFSLHEKENK